MSTILLSTPSNPMAASNSPSCQSSNGLERNGLHAGGARTLPESAWSPSVHNRREYLPRRRSLQTGQESAQSARRTLSASLHSNQRTASPAQGQREAALERLRCYGPRSAPLFFTGLRQLPARLNWEAIPDVTAYHVSVGRIESNGRFHSLIDEVVTGGSACCSLHRLPATPDRLYRWHVTPLRQEASYFSTDYAESAPVVWKEELSGEQEGYFWLIDAARSARLERGRQLITAMGDVDFRDIALSLLLAEVGLYHEGLKQVQIDSERQMRAARTALVTTTKAILYRQMGIRLAQMQSQRGDNALPSHFNGWIAARERHYREQVETTP